MCGVVWYRTLRVKGGDDPLRQGGITWGQLQKLSHGIRRWLSLVGDLCSNGSNRA